jgi:HD superfamily phosphohydrolase
MLVKALELAKDEIGAIEFKSTDDYLRLDDYTVWSMLKKCENSKQILQDIEARRLLKCAFEKTFFTRDETVTSLFTNESVRHQIETEIARKANVELDRLIIDVPSLPSVPYSHSIGAEPMEVPLFDESRAREKTPRKLAEISRVIEVLRVIMNIIRVYTNEADRDSVAQSSREVLGSLPAETKISY